MSGGQVLELLVSVSWQACLVALATGLMVRRTPSIRQADAIWCLAQVSLLGLLAGDLLLPHVRWTSFGFGPSGPWTGWLETALTSLGQPLGSVWLIGALMLLARLSVHAFRMQCILKQTRELSASERHQLRIGLRNTATGPAEGDLRIRVVASHAVSSPFCWQLQDPIIVLPAHVLSFPPDEFALFVRHELAHLQAGHPLRLFLQRLLEACFWFHPAVWWLSRQAERCREIACDEAAAATPDLAAHYVRGLLRFREGSPTPPLRMLAGLSFGAERTLMIERAERLANRDWRPVPAPRFAWVLAVPVLFAVAGFLAVWVPLDSAASPRSTWSPWPVWTARALNALGVPVRDYEIDGHRNQEHRHTREG